MPVLKTENRTFRLKAFVATAGSAPMVADDSAGARRVEVGTGNIVESGPGRDESKRETL